MIAELVNRPFVLFFFSFAVLWITARLAAAYAKRRALDEDVHKDFDVVLSGTLTLLGLIIGFNMLSAVNRYDQRKNYEEEEANAIGTEYLRADFLPAAERAKVRGLLKTYLDHRIAFYLSGPDERPGATEKAARVQAEMWNTIVPAAAAQPTQVMALVVSGMNDVINTQGYTQAAYWNRIPDGAWALMVAVAICANILLGYNVRDRKGGRELLVTLPLVASIAFILIADVDSPRRGFIHVNPQNLEALAESFRTPGPK
jgi:hypothetical protein